MSDLLTRARAGESLAELGMTDLHGHMGRTTFAVPDVSADGLIGAMDRIGVRRIAVSSILVFSPDVELGNADVLEGMRRYPGRVLGYVGIWPTDAATVEKNVAGWLQEGFIGLKLHNSNGFSYMDDAYQGAYAMANARRMPMLFHTWGTAADFSTISTIAEAYPDTSIIMGHAGSTNVEGYIDMARRHPNIYLDLCFSKSPRGLVRRFVDAVGAGRITYGSDACFYSMNQQIGKVLGADISDADKIKILSTNAEHILDRIVAQPASGRSGRT